MKASRLKTAKKSTYMKDENPELRKVARALRNFCEENRARREGNGECLGNSDV
jgi:hypothetical protein